MSADTPTILATSGGLTRGRRTLFGFGPLLHHAIELAGVSGRAPGLLRRHRHRRPGRLRGQLH